MLPLEEEPQVLMVLKVEVKEFSRPLDVFLLESIRVIFPNFLEGLIMLVQGIGEKQIPIE